MPWAGMAVVVLVMAGLRHAARVSIFGDTCGPLRAARKMRDEGRFPGVLDYNLMDAVEGVAFDYPPLIVVVLALFPPAFVERHVKWFVVVSDLIAQAAIAGATWVLSGRAEVALVALVLYAATPGLAALSRMLTGRFLSLALFAISLVCAALWVAEGGSVLLFAAAATGGLLLLSNALAIQAWTVVLLALATFSPRRLGWLTYAALALMSCYVMAGPIAWRVHRGLVAKLATLRSYGMDDIRISGFHLLERLRDDAARPRARSTAAIAARAFLLVDYPYLWALAPALFTGAWRTWPLDLAVWLGALLACHLTIDTLRGLRFVGPAPRYLGYGLVPAALILAESARAEAWPGPTHLLLAAGTLFGVAQVVRHLRLSDPDRERRAETEVQSVAAALRELPVTNLLVLPMPLSDALGYYSGKRMLHGWASRAWGVGPRYGIYPVITRSMDEIVAAFALEGIVIRKDYARFEELKITRGRKVLEDDAFEVYLVGAAAPGPA